MHAPKLRIVWEKPLELPVFEMPKEARVFARERWLGAPLMAGFRRGAGAVLWVAAPPGPQGYERFPYLTQALADLGFEAPFRSAAIVGVLRFGVSIACRSGLFRGAMARGRHQRAACGRVALLGTRSRVGPVSAPLDRRLPSPGEFWFTRGWNCRTSAKSSGTIIRSGARRRRCCRTRSSTGAS